jgi:hypothetical protein
MRILNLFRMCGALLLVQASQVQSQNMPFGECRFGYWESNRNLDDQEGVSKASCFTNWRTEFDNRVKLGFNAHFGINDAGIANNSRARVREGFIEYDYQDFTWRIGRQIIAWGRADRINPTDSFSTRDFTTLLPEEDEQREGINALQMIYHTGSDSSLAVVLAEFEAHRIPAGMLPGNLVQLGESDQPETAVKYEKYGDNLDWSVSYFDGFERFARYSADFTGPSGPLFRGVYEKSRTLGADFATAQGKWTIRGEISYSRKNQDCPGCLQESRNVRQAVMGADRNIGDTANINFQFFSTKRDYTAPGNRLGVPLTLALALDRLNLEYDDREYGMTFRFSSRLLNEQLTFEFPAIIEFTNRSQLFRPRAKYALNDSSQFSVGIDNFHGKEQSFFGSRRKNNTAFIELVLLY